MNKPRIGVVGIPGKWSTEVLADRLETLTGFRAVIDMAQVSLCLDSNRLMYNDLDLMTLDGIIIKKISEIYAPSAEDRVRLLSHLEQAGIPVFSSTRAIGQLINRLSGTLALQQGGVPMPATRATESVDEALAAVRDFGAVVVKPLYSTKARGMLMLDASMDEDSLRAELEAFRSEFGLFYIQQKVNLDGRDLGMVFVDGQYFCTYARVGNKDSWNTTIHSGGHYEMFEPDESLIALGQKAQACFNLSFTTVDIALTDQGPVVFEVSAFGGFKGALEGCGLDAASAYAESVIKSVEEGLL